MKVVHLATTDLGGSYKAVERIHKGLLRNGVESKVLLRTKYHEDSVGEEVIHSPLQQYVSKAKNVGNLLFSRGEFVSDTLGTDMSKHPDVQAADAIIVHWVNSFLSDKGIQKLVQLGKPVLMVAHDMWCCTGGCHYDDYCGRYKQGCGNCPMLKKAGENDLSRKNFLKKKELYQGVTLVGPSSWSVEVARESAIWDGHRIERILNPIDLEVFKPLEAKDAMRWKYNVPKDKKVILYGAALALQNQTKGAQHLREIVSGLNPDEYRLVIFGNDDDEELEHMPIDTMYLGYIRGEKAMCEVYNLADVFLAPSSQESFCYTVGEALACGTPVVAYGIGGILDQIEHLKNGYLAAYGKLQELTEGIEYCCQHAMESRENHNTLLEIGEQYTKLIYEEIDHC